MVKRLIRMKFDEIELIGTKINAQDKLEILRESLPEGEAQNIVDTLISKKFIYSNTRDKAEMYEYIRKELICK
ncbi:hypothetical protein AN639_01115 [Candidatus Epulonipiscium fishelsonii]|uniref:Uncharacterized protein n=1 Tax=Candidatus Epulonipiscium fishelsonii TaxID=77094 RepID=A0ACC8X7X0_9FIRM|nr:hypothetical protein AN396_12130 [Epulopiscium sp. SCG-B11WGA-EpuloA1]ONI40708.1 hypothetical protein AN639_01115 [Epulopiscium sp. SCG-B05WGA-EpuloA1]